VKGKQLKSDFFDLMIKPIKLIFFSIFFDLNQLILSQKNQNKNQKNQCNQKIRKIRKSGQS